MLIVSSQSQHFTIKCTLLSHSSKLLQDFLSVVKSYLIQSSPEAQKLSMLLLIFNSILDCYNREILFCIHSGKNFVVENELFNASLSILTSVRKINFTSGFTRTFEDLRQKFLVNYFLLVSYDSNITSSSEYKHLTQNILENVVDTIDSHDVKNAPNLFALLKVLYIPNLLSKCKTETPEAKESLMREYKAVFERGFRSLLEQHFYTFDQIQAFVEFIFNEKLLIDPFMSSRNEIKECILVLIKECDKKYLLLRIFVNYFLKVLLKYPDIAYNYTEIFKKLMIQKVICSCLVF